MPHRRVNLSSQLSHNFSKKYILRARAIASTPAGMKTFTAKTKLRLVEWNLDPALDPIAADSNVGDDSLNFIRKAGFRDNWQPQIL